MSNVNNPIIKDIIILILLKNIKISGLYEQSSLQNKKPVIKIKALVFISRILSIILMKNFELQQMHQCCQ